MRNESEVSEAGDSPLRQGQRRRYSRQQRSAGRHHWSTGFDREWALSWLEFVRKNQTTSQDPKNFCRFLASKTAKQSECLRMKLTAFDDKPCATQRGSGYVGGPSLTQNRRCIKLCKSSPTITRRRRTLWKYKWKASSSTGCTGFYLSICILRSMP